QPDAVAADVLTAGLSGRGQARDYARCVVTQLHQIESGDDTVLDDDAAADQKMAQPRSAAASHRPRQWIVQAAIARIREIEDRDVRELARRQQAKIGKAEHAGTTRARPAHHLFDADDFRAL